MSNVPYAGRTRPGIPTAEELRARIPGWGADLDPANRPAFPREVADAVPAHAHWELPESQPEDQAGGHPRERSIEHARLTPVFGTTAPLHGLSGAIRRIAYKRYGEARAAHWLMLMAADRVDVQEHRAADLVHGVTALVRGRRRLT